MRPFLTQNGQATFYARISRKNYARYASGVAAPLGPLHSRRDATLRVQKATLRDASAAIKRRSVAKRVLQIFDTRRADPCVVGGAILQISYIIPTIGYIYRRRTYERMRERDKNDIHVSFTNYLCLFMRTLGAKCYFDAQHQTADAGL